MVTLGQARFTVIAPECIRLEYHAQGAFIDAPSLFAIERAARHGEATIRRSSGTASSAEGSGPEEIVIEMGRMRLEYRDDG